MAFGIFIKLYEPNHIISIGNGKILFYHQKGKEKCRFENEEIVWYDRSSNKPHQAINVISIKSFKLVHRWHDLNYYPGQKLWYTPEVLKDGYYLNEHNRQLQVLIVKGEETKRIRLIGAQYCIASFFLEYDKYSNVIDAALFEQIGKKVKNIVDETNVQAVVDSVKVSLDEGFIYRHGDHDDSYIVDKEYSVNSKDPYINRFLPNKSDRIVDESGFCMACDLKCVPDSALGRQTKEEDELKSIFMDSYSKLNHYNSLMYYKLKRYFDSQELYNKAYLRLHEYFPTSYFKDELDYGPINRYEVEEYVLSKFKKHKNKGTKK